MSYDFNGVSLVDNYAEKTFNITNKSKMAGTKYNNIGAREGLSSMMDAGIIEHNLERDRRNYGQGFIKFQALGADGKPDTTKNVPMNINGRTFYPNNGIFTVVDADILKKNYELEQEKREYLKTIVNYATVSDENCAMVLGLNGEAELNALLGVKGTGNGIITDPDLIAVDARPSAMETYDPTSITRSRALQKFKIVLRERMPIVDNFTPAKVQNED